MAKAFNIVLIVGVLFFCAVTSANVTLSTVGSQEVNETNPTVHAMHHVSVDNDTDDGIAGATDELENATQPPLTTRVTLPSGFSSTHPPLVHEQANMNNKEVSSSANLSSVTSPPTPVNINSNSMEHMPKETARSSPTTPTTSSHPPLVHATMEPTAAKSEIPKAQQGHNGVKGLHSSVLVLFICLTLAKSFVVTC